MSLSFKTQGSRLLFLSLSAALSVEAYAGNDNLFSATGGGVAGTYQRHESQETPAGEESALGGMQFSGQDVTRATTGTVFVVEGSAGAGGGKNITRDKLSLIGVDGRLRFSSIAPMSGRAITPYIGGNFGADLKLHHAVSGDGFNASVGPEIGMAVNTRNVVAAIGGNVGLDVALLDVSGALLCGHVGLNGRLVIRKFLVAQGKAEECRISGSKFDLSQRTYEGQLGVAVTSGATLSGYFSDRQIKLDSNDPNEPSQHQNDRVIGVKALTVF